MQCDVERDQVLTKIDQVVFGMSRSPELCFSWKSREIRACTEVSFHGSQLASMILVAVRVLQSSYHVFFTQVQNWIWANH